MNNTKNILLKMGIKNLKAYSSLNSMIIVTMGLGITILFFLGNLSSNISKELNTSIPKNAPDYFFLGMLKVTRHHIPDQGLWHYSE